MGGVKRKIPYGVINWAEVVRECYLVDNTAYIRALEDVKTPVFLRPKRFGKSLWCSMLGYYYDVNFRDRFDELFGKTDIGRSPTPLANSFLVLQFDFSTIQVGTVREIERDFTDHVRTRVREFAKCPPIVGGSHSWLMVIDSKILGRATPDAETVAQARRYRDSLPRRPGWNHPVETYVVEVCGNRGYNWFAV